ncbi:MAG: NAD-dependent dehydratase, partial [Steroidobacteraceae bacterium]
LSVPPRLLRLCGSLTGRGAEVARLCGSLTVDCAETRAELGWSAPVGTDEGLDRTARWYHSEFR